MKKPVMLTIISILLISVFISLLVTIPPEPKQIDTIQDESPISVSNFNDLLTQESYTQTVYSELEEISGTKELSIFPLNSIQSSQTNIAYDSVDYWLLNFTYNKVYQSKSHQEDTSGVIQYNLNQTITTTFFSSMPVILATYRNTTMNANDRTQIITQTIVDENYQANAGFSVEFGLDYFFKAQIFGIGPVIGPGTGSLPFSKKWVFNTPMDGKAILEKRGVQFPVAIPLLNIGVSIGPQIDSDFTASVKSNDLAARLSTNKLEWRKDGSIQSFSLELPEFYSDNVITTDLFDFDMEATLSLVFYLDITIGLAIFKLPFSFPIFSFPIAKAHLQTENIDTLNLAINVNPSEKLPFVFGVNYNFSDVNGDNDGILEPGDIVDFSVWITNLGDGSALGVNSTVDSVNVTVSGQDSTSLLERNRGNYDLHSGFQFSIPSAYSGSFILANATFEYLATNGSTYTNFYELYFRVVQPGDSYLEISAIFLDHPGTYWKTGDPVGIYFNVTNRGSTDITYAELSVISAFDTDTINTATLVNGITNSSSLSIGSSTTLGFVNISTTTAHDDGLIYLYFYVYYEDATYAYIDLLYFAIPIFLPKPEFDIVSAVGYEPDSDGLFEAGETVKIEFTVQNIGEGNAFDVSGIITTDNPDLNITKANVTIGDVAAAASTTSTKATIEIPKTARNQTATFTLYLIAKDVKGHEVAQVFNITIDITELPTPIITLLSYSIDDSVYGNDDGIPDPGEIFLLYINIQVDNVGFRVSGSANTSSELFLYNASSIYGDLIDQVSSGDGFIVEVPLNYPGGNAQIDVTVFGESYAGRKVNATGYIELLIDTGDISAPVMNMLDAIPNQVTQGDDLSFSVNVQDPTPTNEISSGIDRVLLVWAFNEEEIQITEILDLDSDGSYNFKLPTSSLGTYYFIPVAIDVAGNIQFIADNGEVFIVEVISATTTPTTTMTSETTTTTSTKTTTMTSEMTTEGTPIPILAILLSLFLVAIVSRIKQKISGKKR
ncbi:MAG: hypothetical protein ACFFB5_13005 [Promethearchaeota archaeon]